MLAGRVAAVAGAHGGASRQGLRPSPDGRNALPSLLLSRFPGSDCPTIRAAVAGTERKVPVTILSAPVDLNQPGHYLHWGVVQISLANFVVILVMIAVFAVALLLPFPKGRQKP